MEQPLEKNPYWCKNFYIINKQELKNGPKENINWKNYLKRKAVIKENPFIRWTKQFQKVRRIRRRVDPFFMFFHEKQFNEKLIEIEKRDLHIESFKQTFDHFSELNS